MMRIAIRATWFLAAWSLTCTAFAAETEAMLARMQRAAQSLDYDGTFVYQHGNRIESFRIIHRGTGTDGVRERLVSLSGAPREIIRNDREVRCYLPDEKTLLIEPRRPGTRNFPSLLPESFAALNAYYRFRSGRGERVAGHPAHVIAIRPRDRYRFGYRFWTDDDTGLLLKAQLINDEGMMIEQYLFTQITIGKAIADADLRPQSPESNPIKQMHETTAAPGEARWTVARLPAGFSLTARTVRRLSAQRELAEQLVYSDGLAVVSVFVEPAAAGAPTVLDGPAQMGAVHAFGKIVDDYRITVIGEVPAATVSLIGQSVSARR